MHPLAGPFKPPIDLNIYVHYVTTVPTPMCLYDVHNKILIGEYSARCVTRVVFFSLKLMLSTLFLCQRFADIAFFFPMVLP